MRTMGFHTTGSAVKNHISSEMAKELIAKNRTMYHSWFLVYQRGCSSTTLAPTSPSSSSQDSVFDANRYSENPIQKRSGSTSEELRGNPLHKPTEAENKKKKVNSTKYKEIYRTNCLMATGISRESLADESTSTEPWRNPEQ